MSAGPAGGAGVRVPGHPDPATRRARVAVAVLFLVNGAVIANVVPRIPEVKDALGLSNTALGLALAAFPLGALLAGPAVTAVVARWGSARVAVGATLLTAADVLVVAQARSWAVLAAGFLLAGMLDVAADVAQNAQGMRVQRIYRRSILNALHGVWSIGAVAGGGLGALAAGAGVPLTLHLAAVAVVFGGLTLAASVHLLPGRDPAPPSSTGAQAHGAGMPGRRRAVLVLLLPLGLIATFAAVLEDSAASWGAVYLRGELGTGPAVAGLAFIALQGAQTVGRLAGDRTVTRWGEARVARAGGLLAAAGATVALLAPVPAVAVAGFGAAGLGVATLIPSAMRVADDLPGLPRGAGLTVISSMFRIGGLLSPPLVGAVADAHGLRVGLAAVPLAGLAAAVLARFLAPRPPSSPAATAGPMNITDMP